MNKLYKKNNIWSERPLPIPLPTLGPLSPPKKKTTTETIINLRYWKYSYQSFQLQRSRNLQLLGIVCSLVENIFILEIAYPAFDKHNMHVNVLLTNSNSSICPNHINFYYAFKANDRLRFYLFQQTLFQCMHAVRLTKYRTVITNWSCEECSNS